MDHIMVFGGAGYIGSHTCKALALAGFSPIVFDNFSEGHRDFVKWGQTVEGDILDANAVSCAISKTDPIALIHFSSKTYVGESVADPAKYYLENVTGSLNIANAARINGNVPIVFSSTAAVYGVPNLVPIPESAKTEPINPYGRTKLIVENMLDDFGAAYGLNSICLRYFNASGADLEGEIGEDHRLETHLIPRAIFSLMGKIENFEIYGVDYETPDGSPIRDYVHVSDLAHAHVLAVRHLIEGGSSQKINVGTGAGYSALEILDSLKKIAGKRIPHAIGKRRDGDPPILVAEASKAAQLIGFEATSSDLATILDSAYRWHLKRHST